MLFLTWIKQAQTQCKQAKNSDYTNMQLLITNLTRNNITTDLNRWPLKCLIKLARNVSCSQPFIHLLPHTKSQKILALPNMTRGMKSPASQKHILKQYVLKP
jgi:hypothetical protein